MKANSTCVSNSEIYQNAKFVIREFVESITRIVLASRTQALNDVYASKFILRRLYRRNTLKGKLFVFVVFKRQCLFVVVLITILYLMHIKIFSIKYLVLTQKDDLLEYLKIQLDRNVKIILLNHIKIIR